MVGTWFYHLCWVCSRLGLASIHHNLAALVSFYWQQSDVYLAAVDPDLPFQTLLSESPYETPDRHSLPDDFRDSCKCGGEVGIQSFYGED